MSLELNEEIDIKSEKLEEHDFISSEIDIKNEAFEEQDNEFISNRTSGHIETLIENRTDIETEVNPVEIGGEVATTSLLTNSVSRDSQISEVCSNKYKSQHILSKYLRYGHRVVDVEPLNKTSTKCFVCNKTFETQCSLSVHLLSHSKILHQLFSCEKKDSDSYGCKICGVPKDSTAKVVEHIKSVHIGLKEYKCNVCNTYFNLKRSLLKHFNLNHSVIKPLSCVLCSYKACERTSLKRHMLRRHKLNEISVAGLLPAVSDCKKPLNCKVCKVEFMTRDDFHLHISDVHEGFDEFNCPVCQENFICIVDIIAHLVTNHFTKKEQNKEFGSNRTSGHSKNSSGNGTDIKIEVDNVEIGEEVAKVPLLSNSTSEYSHTCRICHKEYRLSHNVKNHLRLKHKIVDLEPFIKCLVKCFLCNETFAEQCDLLVHLLSHAEILNYLFNSEKKDSSPLACKICGATNTGTDKVVQHIKSVHLGLKEYKCKVCNSYFSKKGRLLHHFIFLHSEFEPLSCVVCGSKFSRKIKFKNHMLSKHKLHKIPAASILKAQSACKKTFTCKVCDIKFESRFNFHHHISDVHEGIHKIKCPVCQKDFACIVTLIDHLQANGCTKPKLNNEFESNETSGFSTTEIGGEATTSLLTNSISKNSFQCEICSKRFKFRRSLKKHLKNVHKFGCSIACSICFECNEIFTTQGSLSVHLLSHAEKLHPLFSSEKVDSGTFACKVCGVTQNSNAKVKHHVKSVHLGLKEYKCNVCSTYYTTKGGVMQHFSLQHSLFEPFTCEHCSNKFSQRSSLKRHLLIKHKLEENSLEILLPASRFCNISLFCKVCDVQFKSPPDFHQHISDVHVSLDQIKCPVCQKDFTCIATLIDHLLEHNDSDQPFSCGMCEERFSTENDRSTHLVNFHNKSSDGSSGSSSYECDKCKKVFNCTDQLKKHNLEHLNSNSISCFKCDQCGMFGSYNNLKEHYNCSYPSINNSVICSVCKETFSSVQSLKIHSTNMHENAFETSRFDNTELLVSPDSKIGIVRCEICKQDFDNPTSLMDHFIKIHKNSKNQMSLQQNRRERQKVSQREHRTAEYLKNRLRSSPVKPQLQQAMVRPDCNSTCNSRTEIWITKVKPCCVLLDRGEVTRYLARLDKREEGTVGSSPIEDLPPPLATPPVRFDPSHPCGRVGLTSDHLLSAATSNVGLVCNNIGPRAIVEPKQLCVVNSDDGEVSSNNCIKSENLESQLLGNFEEMYIKSEPFFSDVSDFGDPLSY